MNIFCFVLLFLFPSNFLKTEKWDVLGYVVTYGEQIGAELCLCY